MFVNVQDISPKPKKPSKIKLTVEMSYEEACYIMAMCGSVISNGKGRQITRAIYHELHRRVDLEDCQSLLVNKIEFCGEGDMPLL